MQRACTGMLATCVNEANCAVRRKFNLAAAEGGRPKGRRRRPEMPPKSAARQGGASAFVVYSMPVVTVVRVSGGGTLEHVIAEAVDAGEARHVNLRGVETPPLVERVQRRERGRVVARPARLYLLFTLFTAVADFPRAADAPTASVACVAVSARCAKQHAASKALSGACLLRAQRASSAATPPGSFAPPACGQTACELAEREK
jgi:hypothetical protein